MDERIEVPAGAGRAVPVRAGQHIRVIDVEGGQVGDLFAFAAADPTEYLSASHTRTATSRLFPAPGQSFVTDRRRPILTLTGETSPGVHDMLIAACDPQRYADLGAPPQHASCAENLRTAMAQHGVRTHLVPQPVNLFMRIPVDAQGGLDWLPAISRPGDAVTFEAVFDCVVAVSACPMDLNAINGHRLGPLAIEVFQNSPR